MSGLHAWEGVTIQALELNLFKVKTTGQFRQNIREFKRTGLFIFIEQSDHFSQKGQSVIL